MLPLLGPLALLHPGDAATVVTLHSAEPLATRAYRWTRLLTQRLLSCADAVICATEVSRDTASAVIPHDAHLILPCLELAPFRASVRNPQPDTILFVGRDEPRKGLHVLLEAMRQLPHARLTVAGPVSDRTRSLAENIATDRVTFLGPVPHDDLPVLMSQATCAAFPALGGEALGLVLIEAMAARVPVVASDIDGYRIASNHGSAAMLTPPGDAESLADNLKLLLDDHALQERLVAEGSESANRFDASAIAQQHFDLYQSLLRA